MDNVPLRIHLHCLTGPLLGYECVAAWEALAAEDLWTAAHVVPDSLALAVYLDHACRLAPVAVENVAVGKNLEDDGETERLESPDDLSVGVELEFKLPAVVRALCQRKVAAITSNLSNL